MLNEGSQMDGKGGPNAEENVLQMQSRGDRPVAPIVRQAYRAGRFV